MSEGQDSRRGGPNRCTVEDKNVYTVLGALLDHADFRNNLSREGISTDEFKQKVRELLQIEIEDEQVENLRRVMGLITQTTKAGFFEPYGKIRC